MKIEITIDDRMLAWVKRRRIWLFVGVLGVCGVAVAAQVTVPNKFVAGTKISSAAVNANFDALAKGINALAPSVVPAGAVMFFNLPKCPDGWAPYAKADGRYLVGVQTGGLVGEIVGEALATKESRPSGEHTHGMAHTHSHNIKATDSGHNTLVQSSPSPLDVQRFRRGAAVMAQMFFAAGAERVDLGVRGFARDVRHPAELAAFAHSGPLAPAAYSAAITHMFGTCRMGSDPARSVVGPDFGVHGVPGLYVADSSVFPSATGVNPQIAIAALATLCAARVAGRAPTELLP
ncbi:MAG: choline dehydrogenase [Pseudomonadota bacterium]